MAIPSQGLSDNGFDADDYAINIDASIIEEETIFTAIPLEDFDSNDYFLM